MFQSLNSFFSGNIVITFFSLSLALVSHVWVSNTNFCDDARNFSALWLRWWTSLGKKIFSWSFFNVFVATQKMFYFKISAVIIIVVMWVFDMWKIKKKNSKNERKNVKFFNPGKLFFKQIKFSSFLLFHPQIKSLSNYHLFSFFTIQFLHFRLIKKKFCQ